jgi:hypothetical protein
VERDALAELFEKRDEICRDGSVFSGAADISRVAVPAFRKFASANLPASVTQLQ